MNIELPTTSDEYFSFYKKKDPEKRKKQRREYYQKNKEKYRESARRYQKTLRGYITALVSRIKDRCTNPNHLGYKYYGGRKIRCYFTSTKLYNWVVAKGIDPRGLDIHRIDNDKNYTLGNIEFLTRKEHARLHRLERSEK